jgi:hypothetical protein
MVYKGTQMYDNDSPKPMRDQGGEQMYNVDGQELYWNANKPPGPIPSANDGKFSNTDNYQVKSEEALPKVRETLEEKMVRLQHGVIIKQGGLKSENLDQLAMCEFRNVYHVYARRPFKDKKKGPKEFKCSEKSTCKEGCLSASCKPYRMNISNLQKNSDPEPCMRCVRDCKCTYYSCGRIAMECYLSKSQGIENFLGKVTNPYHCSKFRYGISTDTGKTEYFVDASCNQCYFWSSCPCEGCNSVVFQIFKANETGNCDYEGRESIGEIRRTGRDCSKNLVLQTAADEWSIDFP